jgi:uncharacterized membrane protein YphA (DoxX/SURF4 family)
MARLSAIVLVLRVAIGLLLIVAGVLKAHDGPNATALSIAAYRILPPVAVKLLGVALPYLEILLGGYLVLGLFTRIAAWIATVQFAIFAAAVASLVIRQLPADCGCFGSSIPTPPSWGHVAADVGLALATAFIAWFGPGLFAVDHRLGGEEAAFAEVGETS